MAWFSNAVLQGQLYPRWIPEANYGFGSDAFYYYPPFPYWASCIFLPFTRSPWHLLGLGSALGLVLSGCTCFSLMHRSAPKRAALIGAILYMGLPYHIAIDLLERGAYAEHWAFVWMPLILVGIINLQQQKPGGLALTSFALAGLYITHLPTTVTFVPLALLLSMLLGMRTLFRTIVSLVLSLGIAGLYVAPALLTQADTNMSAVKFPYITTFFFPGWDLMRPLFLPDEYNTRLLWCFVHLTSSYALFYFWIVLKIPCVGAYAFRVRLIVFGVLPLLMMLPISIWLYDLFHPLQMIQFAWRFMVPATFICAFLFALSWPQPAAGVWARRLFRVACGVTVLVSLAMLSRAYSGYEWRSTRFVRSDDRDVPEYVPNRANLAAASEVFSNRLYIVPAGTTLDWKQVKRTEFHLAINTASNGTIACRQFFYPTWRAEDGAGRPIKLAADGPAGTLSFNLPRGVHEITLSVTMSNTERLGLIMTICGALGTFVSGGVDWFKRNRGERGGL